jgi:AraC-like DNA-binding protein
MDYNIYTPSIELRTLVKNYIVINSLKDFDKLVFLPNANNFIVFNRGIRGSSVSLCGTEKYQILNSYCISPKTNKAKLFVPDKSSDYTKIEFPVFLVELLPTAYFKMFHKDSQCLKNRFVDIDENIIDIYFSNLYRHKSIEEELQYLNKTLLKLYKSHPNERLCIEDAIDKIHSEYCDMKVKELIDIFGCSRSTIERGFKKVVGLSPKNYIMMSKFCKTLLAYIEDKKSFKDIQYLYSDNSHINTTFKKYLGIAPKGIFAKVDTKELIVYQIYNMSKDEIST